jgi:hypothetical protein
LVIIGAYVPFVVVTGSFVPFLVYRIWPSFIHEEGASGVEIEGEEGVEEAGDILNGFLFIVLYIKQ